MMALSRNKIAFFDFDGTITASDSLIKFIRYAAGEVKTAWGLLLLSPMFVAYKIKLIPNYKAKQYILSHFFKGMDEQQFQKIAQEYSLNHIDTIVRSKAMATIAWHKAQGHTVAVVSASIENWLKPWCDKNGLDLIATRLQINNGKLTGEFATQNCYGIEKVNRIKERYNLAEYNSIYAYGDDLGDKEMLGIANERYYKHFE